VPVAIAPVAPAPAAILRDTPKTSLNALPGVPVLAAVGGGAALLLIVVLIAVFSRGKSSSSESAPRSPALTNTKPEKIVEPAPVSPPSSAVAAPATHAPPKIAGSTEPSAAAATKVNSAPLPAVASVPITTGPRSFGTGKAPPKIGLSGISRRYDDLECRRIQQEFALRVPSAATILEIDGERLPIANVAELQRCSAPLVFFPAGMHVVRWRPTDGLVEVKRESYFTETYADMRKFFYTGGSLQDAELFSRGARAMDVHGAPFLLNFMGAAYIAGDQWEAAERKFRRALRVNAAFSPAHLNLAKCWSHAGRQPEAMREVQLADAFNVGNVFGLQPAIVQMRRELGMPVESSEQVELSAAVYIAQEATTAEDQRLEALLDAIAKYATREEERGKIRNNLAVHFSDSGRPELALEHFRSALDALKYAGPDRFALARQVFSNMHNVCRKAGFPEADEYAKMQDSVQP
jgi:tetratricopeptide (TPR) repeat protein